ncbi:MAG TPA: 3-oxoadipate CoA-transferase, partial [Polyangia bacterium]|nr:3-oxoadipate CoA-transferase [Polyangia bacterium]
DLAVIDVTPRGLAVIAMADGLDFAALQAATGATLLTLA